MKTSKALEIYRTNKKLPYKTIKQRLRVYEYALAVWTHALENREDVQFITSQGICLTLRFTTGVRYDDQAVEFPEIDLPPDMYIATPSIALPRILLLEKTIAITKKKIENEARKKQLKK